MVGAFTPPASCVPERSTTPSTTISAWAGTRRSIVSHGTISTSRSMIVPTISSSPQRSMCMPEKLAMISYAGWTPKTSAIGISVAPMARYLSMTMCV